jgi:hypothetical protein
MATLGYYRGNSSSTLDHELLLNNLAGICGWSTSVKSNRCSGSPIENNLLGLSKEKWLEL